MRTPAPPPPPQSPREAAFSDRASHPIRQPKHDRGGIGEAPDPTPPPPNFFKALPGAFLYPATISGMLGILLGGVILFSLVLASDHFTVARMSRLGSVVGLVLLYGYFAAFLMKIVTSSAQGDADLPEWPGLNNIEEDILRPLGLCMGAALLCATPGLTYLLATGAGFTDAPTVALWACGLFALPMTLLSVAMFRSTGALNPILLLRTFLRVPLPYLAACATLLFGCVLGWFFETVLHGLLSSFVALYVLLVSMRIMGLLYFTHRARFGWFWHRP